MRTARLGLVFMQHSLLSSEGEARLAALGLWFWQLVAPGTPQPGVLLSRDRTGLKR